MKTFVTPKLLLLIQSVKTLRSFTLLLLSQQINYSVNIHIMETRKQYHHHALLPSFPPPFNSLLNIVVTFNEYDSSANNQADQVMRTHNLKSIHFTPSALLSSPLSLFFSFPLLFFSFPSLLFTALLFEKFFG